MFDQQVKRENMSVVFLEYAWDMNWCDPCASAPLDRDELKRLGVFWLDGGDSGGNGNGPGNGPVPQTGMRRPVPRPPMGGQSDVYVTRLHVRYDGEHFPEDLVFQETGNRENFQGRYVLRHAWTGDSTCNEAQEYRRTLGPRYEKEAQTLASLTGWSVEDIRKKMGARGLTPEPAGPPEAWWQRIWK
jgi:hypothetical protein